jgi:F-type H+-transporting ATPase subunit a
MEGFNLFEEHYWQPFKRFGYTHVFFNLERNTLIATWIILGLLLCAGVAIQSILKKAPDNALRHMLISFIRTFRETVVQSLGSFSLKHFSFITALFIFILLCNFISLIPILEEPTKNLSTTLALSIVSFIYIQYYAIKTQGIAEYLKEYFTPLFIFLPLNIIGKLATVISMAFRLFGNIFGGSTISTIYYHTLFGSPLLEAFGSFSGFNLIITLFFILFEGSIQAFVFAMLSLTYLSAAIAEELPQPEKA